MVLCSPYTLAEPLLAFWNSLPKRSVVRSSHSHSDQELDHVHCFVDSSSLFVCDVLASRFPAAVVHFRSHTFSVYVCTFFYLHQFQRRARNPSGFELDPFFQIWQYSQVCTFSSGYLAYLGVLCTIGRCCEGFINSSQCFDGLLSD